MPEVSVLLPNYNNSAFLKEAIDSVLNQSYSDFELVIVDDGSTDNSVDIIKSYSDPRIKLIEKEKNSGIVDTLNIGLNNSVGKYIIRMDGDDISVAGRFKKLVDFMEAHPEIGVCSSALKTFGAVEKVWPVKSGSDKLKAGFIHGATVPHAPCIIRSSVLANTGIQYRNKHPHMEDYDLFLRLKNVTLFENLTEVLYLYRITENNVTVKNKDTRKERFINIYKDVLNELGIQATEKNVNLHYELFQMVSPTFSVAEYSSYLSTVIAANKQKKIYPEKELGKTLNHIWNTLCCRFIDQDKRHYKSLKKCPHKLHLATRYYYFRKANQSIQKNS